MAMKEFFLSILLAISSFFGINKTQQLDVQPTQVITPTISIVEVIEESPTPTSTTTVVVTAKPTLTKPKSTISESILKTFFGISEKNTVNSILGDPTQLQKYEQEFYRKFLNYPIPRLAISDSKQLIAMPSMNGLVICTGEQLRKLYNEADGIEKDIYYKKMDFDCHHNSKMQETQECQEWRRINDVNRAVPTKGSIDDEIARLQEEINAYANKKNFYDDLLVKYCPK